MKWRFIDERFGKRLITTCLISGLAPLAAQAQDPEATDPDWSPYEGAQGESWFDPGDWFDDPTVAQPYDDYEYYDGYWDSLTWYQKYDFNDAFAVDYDWNSETQQWELKPTDRERGDDGFAYKMDFEYPNPAEGVGTDENQSQNGDSVAQSQRSGNQTTNREGADGRGGRTGGESEQDQTAQTRKAQQDAAQQSQRTQGMDAQNRSGQRATAQEGEPASGKQSLKGEVEGFRKIQLAGAPGYQHEHALARVILDDGQTAVIDLGVADNLDADIERGDKVTLRGSRGKIGDRNVFVVDELESEGEIVYIQRALISQGSSEAKSRQKADESQSQSASTGRSDREPITAEGRIDRVQEVQLPGQDAPQTLIRLRFQDGSAATVSLGPGTSLDELNLVQGDRIRVAGRRQQVEGRSVIVARSISVEGETVLGSGG